MSLRIRLILPILILLFSVFLRFYRFEEFVTFLGDQGRDAIVMKRIVTLEHFPAIGPPSSLGQIFLGPFYYYLTAPFLLLFNFNPVGPAFGVAIISLIGSVIAFLLIKKETNFLTALLFFILSSLSSVNIQFSRFSWNPNLLPVFSFFTLYFFYKLLKTKNKWYAVIFGAFLSFSIQLHHLAFLLIPTIFLVGICNAWKDKENSLITHIFNYCISVVSFLFFSLPLLIFDLRHQYLNSRNFIKMFTEGNPTDHELFLNRFLDTNASFYLHAFQSKTNQYLALFFTIFIFLFVLNKFMSSKKLFVQIHMLNFILFILAFSFFNASRNAHYYNPVYLSFFIVLSWTVASITKNKLKQLFVILAIVAAYLFFNIKTLNYLVFTTGNNQIKKAKNIAESILQKNPQVPYQTVALPYVETDGHIRYFLELKGKRPLPSDTLIEPIQLYALCFEIECQILGNPQWQIAAFKNARIDKIWTVEGVTVYKLIHK